LHPYFGVAAGAHRADRRPAVCPSRERAGHRAGHRADHRAGMAARAAIGPS